MAQEAKRGCGYRKVGGIYLVGEYIPVPCDRLPLEVGACPVCGSGVHFSRTTAEIDPYRLWGNHIDDENVLCNCMATCFVCYPPDFGYIMMVGEKHYATPREFMVEAISMGISKRMPSVPSKMELGKTVVYLAHNKAIPYQAEIEEENGQGRLIKLFKTEYKMGVFSAFIPKKIEMPIWKKDATEETLSALERRGITPVIFEDDDPDHS